MKRDIELIRTVLLHLEDLPPATQISTEELQIPGYDDVLLVEHVAILVEAGLLKAIDTSSHDGDSFLILRLTWSGHEFLSALRDSSIWAKAKSIVAKEGCSWTIDLLKTWAILEAKKHLGIQ